MRTGRLAVWLALSLFPVAVGCGDGEDSKTPLLDASPVGSDGRAADGPLGLDGAGPVDAAADAPWASEAGTAVDAGPDAALDASAIDASVVDAVMGFDGDWVDAGGVDGGSIDAALCTVLPDRFDADTVLPKGCYLVQKNPVIAAAVRLTLSPGVTIIFSEDTGLRFSADQVLVAAGTAAEPILLTGAKAVRGHWRGISFDGTATPDSVLDYVTVEYAGRTRSDRDAAAVKMTADSRGVRASITHTTLRESQGWGLWMGATAQVAAFGNNTLTKNTLGPARVSSSVVGVLDAASKYSGNDRDLLSVDAQYVDTAATWAALDVPYYVDSPLSVSADWTIAAGTTLIMAEDVRIALSVKASLVADGTAEKPITFTAEQPTRGYWQGLIIDHTINPRNLLNHVVVDYAGSVKSDRDAAAVKMTSDSSGVLMKITNSTLRNSEGWGLYLTGSGVMPEFTGNVLTKNALGPVKVASIAAHQLLPASTYVGNDVDQVAVMAGYISEAVTWQSIGVPYVLDKMLQVQKVWTVAPGVVLMMGPDASIEVSGDDSALHAVGTATAPITITGVEKTPGAWESIVFGSTLNAANALDYCIVEYGGGGTARGWDGMILATSDSHGVSFSLTNSIVRNSAVYGVWLGHYAQLTQSGNTFSGNASGDVYQQP